MRTELSTLIEHWSARPLTEAESKGYLDWSLDFFTDNSVEQDPFVDITLQLDVTRAYAAYQAARVEGLSFFSFLVWHLARAMQGNLGFKLRKIEGKWWVLDNAPIVTPIAVGGEARFTELLLKDASRESLAEFARQYREKLDSAKRGEGTRMDPETFLVACFIGNLPQLQFTALSLHSRKSSIQCQPCFYFGQRYFQGEKLFIPFAAKLHHACTDPHVLNQLVEDFQARFSSELL